MLLLRVRRVPVRGRPRVCVVWRRVRRLRAHPVEVLLVVELGLLHVVLLQRDAGAGGRVDGDDDELHEHAHHEVDRPVAREHAELGEHGGVRRGRRGAGEGERAGEGGEDGVDDADAEEGQRGGDRDEQRAAVLHEEARVHPAVGVHADEEEVEDEEEERADAAEGVAVGDLGGGGLSRAVDGERERDGREEAEQPPGFGEQPGVGEGVRDAT